MKEKESFDFTVITPTYNAGETIESCIESVHAQKGVSIEHIIIDGHSQDNTLPIVRSCRERLDHLKVISEKDQGVYDAMNKGLKSKNSTWVYFLGADDRLATDDIFSKVLAYAKRDDFDIIHGDVLVHGNTTWAENGRRYDGAFDAERIKYQSMCHQSVFYHRSLIDKPGYFDLKYKICADWDYNLRCWHEAKIGYLDEVVAHFYAGGVSSDELGDEPFETDRLGKILSIYDLSSFNKNIVENFRYHPKLDIYQKEENKWRWRFNRYLSFEFYYRSYQKLKKSHS